MKFKGTFLYPWQLSVLSLHNTKKKDGEEDEERKHRKEKEKKRNKKIPK